MVNFVAENVRIFQPIASCVLLVMYFSVECDTHKMWYNMQNEFITTKCRLNSILDNTEINVANFSEHFKRVS